MASLQTASDAAVLQKFIPRLEADGFTVLLQPPPERLPEFLKASQPDAIAFKGDRHIAIQVASPGSDARERQALREKLLLLQRTLHARPGWELEVIYAPRAETEEIMPPAPRPAIEAQLARVAATTEAMGAPAALLSAWAAFEAAGRLALPETLGKPQPALQLVETLASLGYLTPDSADRVRALGRHRNALAHGQMTADVTPADVADLLTTTRLLLELAEPAPAPA